MTLQQLEYIVALDKHSHFVRAAQACGVSQSTLSTMIQRLEQELDTTIFERTGHPVRPTETGRDILGQARIILHHVAQLREIVQGERQRTTGTLSLGVVPTIAPYVVPQIFSYIHEHHQGLNLQVEEDRNEPLMQKLRRAEVDVALMPTSDDTPELLEIPVYSERFVAYVSPLSPLHGHTSLCLDDLPAQGLWTLRESYCPQNDIFSFCRRAAQSGETPAYAAGSIDTLVRIVDSNGGYTIIPELHVSRLDGRQQENLRPLCRPEPARTVALVVRRDFMREGMLNIIVDALKNALPPDMICNRVRRFAVRL